MMQELNYSEPPNDTLLDVKKARINTQKIRTARLICRSET